MGKILDKEFRSDLYKNLCEAGYSKTEATSIVSTKYSAELKEKLIEGLKEVIRNIDEDKFIFDLPFSTQELTNDLTELNKIKEFFEKNEKSS